MKDDQAMNSDQFELLRDHERILHGTDDEDGALARVQQLRDDFYGTRETMGAKTKLDILWRGHIWLLCTLSAGAGSGLTFVVERLLK